MANEFKLVWEDSPDTPVSAQNLSKSVEKSSEDIMLFFDKEDSLFKFRANSKLPIPFPRTNGFFSFDGTYKSHNGKFNPVANNATFRIESVAGDNAIAIDSATENLFTNSDFSNGLTDWVVEASGSSEITIEEVGFYGDNAARIEVDPTGNLIKLNQTITLPELNDVSISFYYKSIGDAELNIVGDPESGSPKYWKSDGLSANWEPLEINATKAIPESSTWKRVEIKDIYTSGLSTNEIKIQIAARVPGAVVHVDAVQIEYKDYCSSYTPTTRDDSFFEIDSSIINMEKGLVDIQYIPKKVEDRSVVFLADTVGNDALKLYWDASNDDRLLVFSVYNTDTSSYVETAIDMGDDTDFIDTELRILCSWEASGGVSLYVNDEIAINNTVMTPYANSEILSIKLGGRYGATKSFANGIYDALKINIQESSSTEIATMLDDFVKADINEYKLYESGNNDIIISGEMLDLGDSFTNNSRYYLWLCGSIMGDTAQLVVSRNGYCPEGYDVYTCYKIGGFTTDSTGEIDLSKIWDIGTRLHHFSTARFVTLNEETDEVYVEFKGDPPTATFNVPVRFTNDFIVDNGLGIESGVLRSDYIQIEGNTISSFSGMDLNIYPETGQDTNITGSTITLDSGMIQLNKLNVVDSSVTTDAGYDLSLNSNSGSDILLNAYSNQVKIAADTTMKFEPGYRQFINYGTTIGIGYQAESLYARTDGDVYFYKNGTHSNTNGDAGGGDILAAITDGESVTVSPDSKFFAGRVYNAIWNDLAECWDMDKQDLVDYKQVAVQTIYGIRPSKKRAEKASVGIVSNTYGYILNSGDFNEDLTKSKVAPIAVAGRAIVKSKNRLQFGDEVVSYKNGMVIRANWFEKVFKRDRILGRMDSQITGNEYWIKVQ